MSTTAYSIDISSGSYEWILSGSGTNEYYLRNDSGASPNIDEPIGLSLNGTPSVEGTLASLANTEWAYGDQDTLGYSTVYFRYDTDDPDTLGWGKLVAHLTQQNVIHLSNPLYPKYQRIVRAPEDFFPIESSVVYVVDGTVDMGSVSIEVPAGGLSIIGYSFDVSKLISSEVGYTLFSSPEGGSGNLLASDIAIEITGVGSKVYDLVDVSGFSAFEFARVNYNSCTSLGTIDNYRQGLEVGTGRFGGEPSLTLKGVWVGGYRLTTSIVRSLDSGMTEPLFKAGVGFTMASRFLTDINCDLPPLAALADFAPANFINPSTLQLNGAIISRDGVFDATDSNILPNIGKEDIASIFSDNKGIRNTFVGGRVTVSGEVTTTVSASSTFYTLNATWASSSLEHFDNPSLGQLRHLGDTPIEYGFIADLTVDGNANDDLQVRLRKYDASLTTTSTVTTQSRQVNNLSGGRDVAFFTIIESVELNANDYVFLEVANISGTGDVTVELDSFLAVDKK